MARGLAGRQPAGTSNHESWRHACRCYLQRPADGSARSRPTCRCTPSPTCCFPCSVQGTNPLSRWQENEKITLLWATANRGDRYIKARGPARPWAAAGRGSGCGGAGRRRKHLLVWGASCTSGSLAFNFGRIPAHHELARLLPRLYMPQVVDSTPFQLWTSWYHISVPQDAPNYGNPSRRRSLLAAVAPALGQRLAGLFSGNPALCVAALQAAANEWGLLPAGTAATVCPTPAARAASGAQPSPPLNSFLMAAAK